MNCTEYSWLTTEELLIVASCNENPTSLEIELSQRLAIMLVGLMHFKEQDDTGRPHQKPS